MRQLVNARKAASAIGVSCQTLYKKFEQREVPGFRLGKALRFDVEELFTLMRENAAGKLNKDEE